LGQASIARELTKLHEEWMTGTLTEVLERWKARPKFQGECSIVLHPKPGQNSTARLISLTRSAELDPQTLREVVEAIHKDQVLVVPTDTVYGIGGRALDAVAVERTFLLKGREPEKPLPLVAADLAQETVARTSFSRLCPGALVNLEGKLVGNFAFSVR